MICCATPVLCQTCPSFRNRSPSCCSQVLLNDPSTSTIVSLMVPRRRYLYVSTEPTAPRRPEEPCRGPAPSIATGQSLPVCCALPCSLVSLLVSWRRRRVGSITLPTHFFFLLHDPDCHWIWGMDLPRDEIISPYYVEIETSPGPVIAPLRMAKVWKVR